MSKRDYKVVVLGSGGVGKSCLTAQFVSNLWIDRYDPTIEDSYRKQIEVDGRRLWLEVIDTAGTEQFTAMREIYMKSGQGFLLVFSITSASSLAELHDLRDQLVLLKDDPNVPIVLVGNKSDLEDDREVSRARAFAVSQAWGNTPYYETSARRAANVNEVFVDVCRQIIRGDLARAGEGDGYAAQAQGGGEYRRRRRHGSEDHGDDGEEWRPRRRRGRRRRHTHCVIL